MQTHAVGSDVVSLLIRHVRRSASYLPSCRRQVRRLAADSTNRVGARRSIILASPTSSALALPVICVVSFNVQTALKLSNKTPK